MLFRDILECLNIQIKNEKVLCIQWNCFQFHIYLGFTYQVRETRNIKKMVYVLEDLVFWWVINYWVM